MNCDRKEIRKSKIKELNTLSCQWYGLHEAGLKDTKEYRDLEIQVTNLREELRKDKENES